MGAQVKHPCLTKLDDQALLETTPELGDRWRNWILLRFVLYIVAILPNMVFDLMGSQGIACVEFWQVPIDKHRILCSRQLSSSNGSHI